MALTLSGGFSYPVAFLYDGVPPTGTDEVQTLTMSGGGDQPSGGSVRLSAGGVVSAEIPWNATTAQVETALNTLPTLGAGGTASVGVAVTGGDWPGTAFTVTFSGTQVSKRAQSMLVLHRNDLTGAGTPTVTIAESTPGVDVPGRGILPGHIAINGRTGQPYYNSGTALNPVWTQVP